MWRWLCRRDEGQMSAVWRAEQDRRDQTSGDPWQGVSWRRPYNRRLDANGWFNRYQEQQRKRA